MDSFEMHMDDASRVMSDNDHDAQRKAMARLAELSAEFVRFWMPYREKLSAFVIEWDGDPDPISYIDSEFTFLIQSLQKRVRLHFAQRYIR